MCCVGIASFSVSCQHARCLHDNKFSVGGAILGKPSSADRLDKDYNKVGFRRSEFVKEFAGPTHGPSDFLGVECDRRGEKNITKPAAEHALLKMCPSFPVSPGAPTPN